MNKEQFGQFWEQLKTPLKAKWVRFTEEDLVEIKGDLDKFGTVLQKRYGELQKDEVDAVGQPPLLTLVGELSWI